MRTALFLSPHLDDVVFSCGGLLAQLGDAGWRTVMVTAFTATVLPVSGFALACQLDKGLAPEVDYMALRRAEDRDAADTLGVSDLRWLGLPEAPHRGYGSPPSLFGPFQHGDEIWRPLAGAIAQLLDEFQPEIVLAPQGLGAHVDHRQMIRAVQAACPADQVAYYRDTPYAIRNPGALAYVSMEEQRVVPIASGLDRKIHASCAYASQIGFQFGGAAALSQALTHFAMQEGAGHPAERFLSQRDLAGLRP